MKDRNEYFTCPTCGTFATTAAVMVSECCPECGDFYVSTETVPDASDPWEAPYTAAQMEQATYTERAGE